MNNPNRRMLLAAAAALGAGAASAREGSRLSTTKAPRSSAREIRIVKLRTRTSSGRPRPTTDRCQICDFFRRRTYQGARRRMVSRGDPEGAANLDHDGRRQHAS
jgi:hypothetical protein